LARGENTDGNEVCGNASGIVDGYDTLDPGVSKVDVM
jgi:hypothetical protein